MKSIVLIASISILAFIQFGFSVMTDKMDTQETISPAAEELEWYTSFEEAMLQSKKQQKPIFAFFTGSDWCGWCTRLQRDVFVKEAFKTWAKDEVILLELDFPKRKVLSPELKKQNAELAQAFKVRGYPTIWLFYAERKEDGTNINMNALGSLGYPSGATKGKEEVTFLKSANSILAKDKTKSKS